MKEEVCYVAFNPATEEKVTQPDTVYKLPDGQTIRVSSLPFIIASMLLPPFILSMLPSIFTSTPPSMGTPHPRKHASPAFYPWHAPTYSHQQPPISE